MRIPAGREAAGGTAWMALKKSTDLPTTTASMNMATPMGSRSRISMSRMVRDTAMEAVPYRMPRVLDRPRFSTSQGPAPMLAWMVR